jgi:hypothetical protein
MTQGRALLTSSPVSWGRIEVGVERESGGCLSFAALPRSDLLAMCARVVCSVKRSDCVSELYYRRAGCTFDIALEFRIQRGTFQKLQKFSPGHEVTMQRANRYQVGNRATVHGNSHAFARFDLAQYAARPIAQFTLGYLFHVDIIFRVSCLGSIARITTIIFCIEQVDLGLVKIAPRGLLYCRASPGKAEPSYHGRAANVDVTFFKKGGVSFFYFNL